jgi:hypothetical protein
MQVEIISDWEGYLDMMAVIKFYQDFPLDNADIVVISDYFKPFTERIAFETDDGHNYTIRTKFKYKTSLYDMNKVFQDLDQYLYDIEQ